MMDTRFSEPQRQSPVGVMVMFFDTVRHFVRGLWPILVVWFFKFDEINSLYIVSGITAVFLAISITAYLKYRNFTFYLDDDKEEFIISEGVFNKTKTVVRLDKIQQVNITQSLIQRVIGVYALEIDTAGTAKEEGKIKAVSHELALALKSRLLENDGVRKSDTVQTDFVAAEERPFMKIGLLTLLKVGITSNYIRSFWLLLLFFATVYDNLQHLSSSSSINRDTVNSYIGERLAIASVSLVVLIFVLAIFVINVVRVIVRYFGFTMARQSGSLLLSFGLISTKSTIIKPEKVQIVTITRNYFQKKMNILEMKIRQAAGGESAERRQAIEIPGCDSSERDAILKLLYHAVPEKGVMLKPNFRKLVFSIFLLIVLPLGVLSFFLEALSEVSEFGYLIPVYVIFVLAILCAGFRNYRLYVGERFIIKQGGAWDISNDIIEPGKIQAITTSQLFWHKNADIGYLTLHTAAGNISFQLGDFTVIKRYVNLWLYEMEASDSNWM
jgi:uncharacterized membrane protein YdbT with pleckstrin-like domain